MHEIDFQNWLNHARSVGYTDTEIRTLLLKAGWSYTQVNEAMAHRGLTPGTAITGARGKLVTHPAKKHLTARIQHYVKVGLLIIAVVVAWAVAYWAWQR